jgi:predicted aspartyl protease
MITIIPFKLLKIDNDSYHLMIKAYINKKLVHLIIDTGASRTVFDKTKIEKYVGNERIEEEDKLSSGLGTNTMTSQTTIIKKLKIGELEITHYNAVLLDLSHVNESYEQVGLKQLDGVLGSDILVKYNAVIDYEKKVLKLKFKKKK